MYYTIAELEKRVKTLKEKYGELAPVAVWIYTEADVREYQLDNTYTSEQVEDVLVDLGDTDYICEYINDCLDDVMKENKLYAVSS